MATLSQFQQENMIKANKELIRNVLQSYRFNKIEIKYEHEYERINYHHDPYDQYPKNVTTNVREIVMAEVDIKNLETLCADFNYYSCYTKSHMDEERRADAIKRKHPQVQEAYNKYMAIMRLYS
jgi:hypothetical protein